jgi:hypothetical protein
LVNTSSFLDIYFVDQFSYSDVILLILFFINVPNDIVKGITFDENNHPSIDRIRRKAPKNNIDFDFKPTNTDTITKLVNKINIKKATGVDQISCIVQQCTYFLFFVNLLLVGVKYGQRTMQVCS